MRQPSVTNEIAGNEISQCKLLFTHIHVVCLACLLTDNFTDIFAENARKRSVSDSGLLFSLFMSRFNDR